MSISGHSSARRLALMMLIWLSANTVWAQVSSSSSNPAGLPALPDCAAAVAADARYRQALDELIDTLEWVDITRAELRSAMLHDKDWSEGEALRRREIMWQRAQTTDFEQAFKTAARNELCSVIDQKSVGQMLFALKSTDSMRLREAISQMATIPDNQDTPYPDPLAQFRMSKESLLFIQRLPKPLDAIFPSVQATRKKPRMQTLVGAFLVNGLTPTDSEYRRQTADRLDASRQGQSAPLADNGAATNPLNALVIRAASRSRAINQHYTDTLGELLPKNMLTAQFLADQHNLQATLGNIPQLHTAIDQRQADIEQVLKSIPDEAAASLPESARSAFTAGLETSYARALARQLAYTEVEHKIISIYNKLLTLLDSHFSEYKLENGRLVFANDQTLASFRELMTQYQLESKIEDEVLKALNDAASETINRFRKQP